MITLEAIRSVVREEISAVIGQAGPGKSVLSAAEACRLLGVSRSTLQTWMQDGRLPVRRVHGKGRIFFFRQEIEEALKRFGRKAVWQA